MKTADIVIGLGWGDEGKGRVVSQLCTKYDPEKTLVVRFSGGNNSTHRVMYQDKIHDFSSFGSGCLQGAASYLDSWCCIDPLALETELIALKKHGLDPTWFVSPLVGLISPYDKLLQEKIATPGTTTGVGMYYATTCDSPTRCITSGKESFDSILEISYETYSEILKSKGLDYIDRSNAKDLEAAWLAAIWSIINPEQTKIHPPKALYDKYDHVIFEGSQGILLDQVYGLLPDEGTPANTGLTNLLNINFPADTHIYGVTRSYATRHGSGFFPCKPLKKPLKHQHTESNKTNDFQGVFRKGVLSKHLHEYAWHLIEHQVTRIKSAGIVQKDIIVTCCDQYKMPRWLFDREDIGRFHSPITM